VNWHPWREVYRKHSFVFKELFKILMIETMLMAVLVTLTSINNEYVKRTNQLISSTKTGRNLLKCKFRRSILAFIILASIIFTVHFIVFNYSNMLDVPVTSILFAYWQDISKKEDIRIIYKRII
jgi:hypothetical protein